jgi:hypothetical protein
MIDRYLQDWLDKNMPQKLDHIDEDEDAPLHVIIWGVIIFAAIIGMVVGGLR